MERAQEKPDSNTVGLLYIVVGLGFIFAVPLSEEGGQGRGVFEYGLV